MDFSEHLHKSKLWLGEHAERPPPKGELGWGGGSDRVAIFHDTCLEVQRAADTEEGGTFAWSEFVPGAPGMRLGGGTDEIQRNTIAERLPGLPREPR